MASVNLSKSPVHLPRVGITLTPAEGEAISLDRIVDETLRQPEHNQSGRFRPEIVNFLLSLDRDSDIDGIRAARLKLEPAVQQESHLCHSEAILVDRLLGALESSEKSPGEFLKEHCQNFFYTAEDTSWTTDPQYTPKYRVWSESIPIHDETSSMNEVGRSLVVEGVRRAFEIERASCDEALDILDFLAFEKPKVGGKDRPLYHTGEFDDYINSAYYDYKMSLQKA